MQEIIDKIRQLTKLAEEKGKGIDGIYLSCLEELGELARAIKIEDKIPGNAHKSLDEPSYSEAIDLFICIASLEITKDPEVQFIHSYDDSILFHLAEQRELDYLMKKVTKILSYDIISYPSERVTYPICIYYKRGGKLTEFKTIALAKLDKWEKTL